MKCTHQRQFFIHCWLHNEQLSTGTKISQLLSQLTQLCSRRNSLSSPS